RCVGGLVSPDRHKTKTVRGPDLWKALAYDPEGLAAGARLCKVIPVYFFFFNILSSFERMLKISLEKLRKTIIINSVA
ncbi:hypothetical protein ACVBAX_20820, partial [Robertmurraya sp. GLU-23]